MKIKVLELGDYKKVVAVSDIEVGDEVYRCSGKIVSEPTRTSIQSPYGHMEDTTSACINHNCNPNTVVLYVNKSLQFIAISNISEGDEITFNYNTTETELAEPFRCNCCGNLIRGERYE
tara:strand:- start:441 stop:797 length:357 start_codon:yes stop_codon:yes gene_type:complete